VRRSRYRGPMRSGFEDTVRTKLEELGVRYEYEKYALEYWKPIRDAVCFECTGAKVFKRCWYYPDFWLPDHGFYIEAKGKFGQVDRMKMRLVKEAHPDEDIRMLFMRDNLIGKQAVTRTRYTEYAEKYGMPSLVIENMGDWFNENSGD
jgi:hypothetical protein